MVEQIGGWGVGDADPLLAGTKRKRFEDVPLAGAGLACDDEVIAAANEVESGELQDKRLVELGLEVPIEGFERLSLHESTDMDSARDALLELVRGLEAEDVLEQGGGARPLPGPPAYSPLALPEGQRPSEELQVSP